MEGFDTYILLADEIGDEVARQVFEMFAGHTINFPKRVSFFFRDLEILKRFDKGESYEELARIYRLTPQHIRHITSRESRRRTVSKKRDLSDSQNF